VKVSEVFWSIQGEGLQAGKPMVFLRLAGCNATPEFQCWRWCDTQYAKGQGKEQGVSEILNAVTALPATKWVCLTGGEPLAQPLTELLTALHDAGRKIALETNGTLPWRDYHFDWVAVSPKLDWISPGHGRIDEVKWVIANEADLQRIKDYGGYTLLQPCHNQPAAIGLCLLALKEHPDWRLSLQLHKIIKVR